MKWLTLQVLREKEVIDRGGDIMQQTAAVTISDAEWEIMRVVWANIAVTSREVIDVLTDKMDWKESTIKTLMSRLVDKEALQTERDGRRFIYTANISEKDTVENYSDDILERVCNTKDVYVVEHLIEDAKLSQENIQDLINQLEAKKQYAPETVSCDCTPGQCDCHKIS